MSDDDYDLSDLVDTDAAEVRHLINTTGVSETDAWRILDQREAARIAALMARFDTEGEHVSTCPFDHASCVAPACECECHEVTP